jgi:hypothetical protein
MVSIVYLLASVAVGAAFAAMLNRYQASSIKFFLTFSGAYLLGIGVFHLLPEVYESHSHHYGLMIMAGFFIQLILEAFSKGLEHGHSHSEMFQGRGLPIGVLASLFLHAFIESMALGGHGDPLGQKALLWGLLVHKIPVTIILFNMLREFKRKWTFLAFWLFLFAMMAPLGVLVGELVPLLSTYHQELTALVFGIFLHISTTILFESNKSHRFNIYKLSVIIFALALAWLSVSH